MPSWLLQVFFDLELEGGCTTELCIKEGPAFSVTRVKDLRDDVKLGDTVLVTGTTDPGDPHVILPSGISVTTRWKDAHPGKHFVPKCRPKKPLQSEAQENLTEARGEPDGPAELVKGASGRREDSHAAAVKHAPSSSQQVIEIVPCQVTLQHYIARQGSIAVLSVGTALFWAMLTIAGIAALRLQPCIAIQVCKFHINGGCQKGDMCPHLHVDLSAAPRVRKCWIAERCALFKQLSPRQDMPIMPTTVVLAPLHAPECRAIHLELKHASNALHNRSQN